MADPDHGARRNGAPFVNAQPRFGIYRDWRLQTQTIYSIRSCSGTRTRRDTRQIADRWGIVFDRVNGVSFAEQMQGVAAPRPEYLEILARLHTRIHAHPANQFRSLKVWLATSITRTTLL